MSVEHHALIQLSRSFPLDFPYSRYHFPDADGLRRIMILSHELFMLDLRYLYPHIDPVDYWSREPFPISLHVFCAAGTRLALNAFIPARTRIKSYDEDEARGELDRAAGSSYRY